MVKYFSNLRFYLLNNDCTRYAKNSGLRNCYESWGCVKIRNVLLLLAKKCTALVESAGTTVSPSRCLQNQGSVVGDVCTFSCTAGYELPSSVNTLVCLTTGSWNGSVINCQSKWPRELDIDTFHAIFLSDIPYNSWSFQEFHSQDHQRSITL